MESNQFPLEYYNEFRCKEMQLMNLAAEIAWLREKIQRSGEDVCLASSGLAGVQFALVL